MKTLAKIDHARQLTTYIVTGELDWMKIKSVIQDQIPGYLPLNTLWDLRKSSIGEISLQALEEIVTLMQQVKSRQGGKTAVVVPAESKNSFVARLENLINQSREALPMEIRFFRHMDEASGWVTP